MAPLASQDTDNDIGDEEQLSLTFAALANQTRRAILARLVEGEANVNQLAEPFAMSLPAISKHLRVLERAGLVERSQRAQFRPCTLNAAPLEAVASWTEHYRPIWEDRFDRLDAYLGDLQSETSATRTSPINPSSTNSLSTNRDKTS